MKLERGKSKDVLLALPDKNLKHTRKIGASFENALRKDVPKMGERASTGIFAHNSVLGYAPTTHYPIDSVCFSLGYQLVVMVQPSQDRNCNHLGSLVRRGTKQSIRFGNLLLNTLMRSCSIEVCHIRDFALVGVVSHGRSADGQGILASHSSKSVRRRHSLVAHDTAF